jgi:hypothetical protein
MPKQKLPPKMREIADRLKRGEPLYAASTATSTAKKPSGPKPKKGGKE